GQAVRQIAYISDPNRNLPGEFSSDFEVEVLAHGGPVFGSVNVSQGGAVLQCWIDHGELRERKRESTVPVERRGDAVVQCLGRALRGEASGRLDRTGRAVPLLPRRRVTNAVTSADH